MTDDAPHSRWQDFWEKTLPVIIGGIIAGIFAIAGSYFATTFQRQLSR
jgi:formate/nitrite transporter FocA (FNT family)